MTSHPEQNPQHNGYWSGPDYTPPAMPVPPHPNQDQYAGWPQPQATAPDPGPSANSFAGAPAPSGAPLPPGSSAYVSAPPPAPVTKTKKRSPLRMIVPTALIAALASSGITVAALQATSTGPGATTQVNTNTVVQGSPANPDWTQTAKVAAPSVVSIAVQGRTGGAEGSGVVYDRSGNIVTNNHVVNGVGNGAQLQVTLFNNQVYAATLVGSDPSTDLAVIRLQNPPNDLRPIALGDANALTVGQPVMALGNPLGLSETVTTGIVSALDRPVITQQSGGNSPLSGGSGQQSVTNAIQTNAAINPGNSGGALVDVSGKLIGITSSIASLGNSQGESGNIGIGFAIPVNQVRTVADQLISGGTVRQAYLGVNSTDATARVDTSTFSGAGVRQVVSGSPADQAGIRAGDVILGIDEDTVPNSESLIAQVRERSVGDRVTLKIARGNSTVDIPVTLAAGQ